MFMLINQKKEFSEKSKRVALNDFKSDSMKLNK